MTALKKRNLILTTSSGSRISQRAPTPEGVRQPIIFQNCPLPRYATDNSSVTYGRDHMAFFHLAKNSRLGLEENYPYRI